jgi:hypothetical protein
MLSLLSQIIKFSRVEGKPWMAVLMIMLLGVGGFLLLVGQSSVLGPFIYAIF